MSNKTFAQVIIPASEIDDTRDLAARLQAKIIRDNPSGIMRRGNPPIFSSLHR